MLDMNTVITDWFVVSVYDENLLIGKVLYGTVIDDSSCRYLKGDYVCTSTITAFNVETKLVKTQTGSLYQVLDNGQYDDIQLSEFELLRQGCSPQEIKAFRSAPRHKFH